MDVKVLGAECANCHRLYRLVRDVILEMDIEATLSKVTDLDEIMAYNVMFTPGLVINGKVVSVGRIPTRAEVTTWLANALMAEKA